jgi:PPOX class probable F420-dependent enzyme
MLDPVIRDLARGKNFGALSFHFPNGSIGTHLMWVDADDDHVSINTEVHRAKYKAIQADPNVTITIISSENTYAYAEVRGKVTSEVRGPEARAGIDALARKYTGSDYAPEITSERVILQITPDHQRKNNL